ncbi:hypothetical protein JS528_11185 [Bifidobacterium sp. MA2]|uniref:DUF6273 domain-containing protein n=1 Tax=Bifidobacterium santillanense TaxID=2809028 RepID=A0ABS5US92_9BIFI|nr:DUF6273 domain-containing protein [Bifidobacterium santillanense]MBT1173883.1 hypothetical protein [Bifidobacterium santillanense]
MDTVKALDALIRSALQCGARIDISLTPKNWAADDGATINASIPVTETEGRQTFTIGGRQIEYRLIPNGTVITCVPTVLWPDEVPFDKDGSNKWKESSLRYWLNHEFWLENMPDELKRTIVPTKHDGVEDLIWLPSEAEVFGTAIYSDRGLAKGEVQLFPDKASRRLKDTNGEKRWWWTCSARSGSANRVPNVSTDGAAYGSGARSTSGAALPCFNLAREGE